MIHGSEETGMVAQRHRNRTPNPMATSNVDYVVRS